MIRYGWVCPKCQKVNNPDNRMCAGSCSYPDSSEYFQTQQRMKEMAAQNNPSQAIPNPYAGRAPWDHGPCESDL